MKHVMLNPKTWSSPGTSFANSAEHAPYATDTTKFYLVHQMFWTFLHIIHYYKMAHRDRVMAHWSPEANSFWHGWEPQRHAKHQASGPFITTVN